MTARIKAVTFDLWDTIIRDDSDEPKRRAAGLVSKKAERRRLVWQALDRRQPISRAAVDRAYDAADAAFDKVWREQHMTWVVEDRLRVVLDGLGRTLPAEAMAALIEAHEGMEMTVRPEPVPGVAEALARLHGRYKLAVVSDAIVSPGRALRRLLGGYDFERYFDAFVFSDEVGRSKPHPLMFETAASALGVTLTEMLHVGDREHNDIEGPKALGMKTVLFTGTRAAEPGATAADAVCARHEDLPDVIDRLAGRSRRRRESPKKAKRWQSGRAS